MELGTRLKQARLDAGLSQRQLCSGLVTRNMLSLIENGSARPSMDTMCALAKRLGKPVSYFLEEHTVTSPNQACMARAREAAPEEVSGILEAYQAPDPVFDRERWLLEALAAMALARRALDQNRIPYARTLLARAGLAGERTPYFTEALKRERLLMCHEARCLSPEKLAAGLPDNRQELLLRACAAADRKQPLRVLDILAAVDIPDAQTHYLAGQALQALGRFQEAAEHYTQSLSLGKKVYAALEICYRELGDFEKAYSWACRQK